MLLYLLSLILSCSLELPLHNIMFLLFCVRTPETAFEYENQDFHIVLYQ